MNATLTPITTVELTRIATDLQEFVGAQLQDCVQTESDLGLAFYHLQQTIWIWFDLKTQRPVVVRLQGSIKNPAEKLRKKKVARPLTLFVKSRFRGRRLASVRVDLSRGRILLFEFHRSREEENFNEPCVIEARLFPHGQNVAAIDGTKSVYEVRPKDLPPVGVDPNSEEGRSWEEIEEQWRTEVGWNAHAKRPSDSAKLPVADGVAPAVSPERTRLEKEYKRAVEKKEQALRRMEEEMVAKSSSVYSEVGEWLKSHVHEDAVNSVPEKWIDYVDTSKSFAWNLEKNFHRAKENLRKREGTRQRMAIVEKELAELKAKGVDAFQKAREKTATKEKKNLLSGADARGRRLKIGEDLEVYIGKSAADNLALLRRAQSFDYWLHLRDQPGSHAILRRSRQRLVKDAEFLEAGRWVIEQSLNKRVSEMKGEAHDLLIVECRFVRPIKGDKLGRVNYTNDRVLRVHL